MSDFNDLQMRLSSALERVTAAVTQLEAPSQAKIDALTAELDGERMAKDLLESQLQGIRSEFDEQKSANQSQSNETQTKMAALDLELQKLRQANVALREVNAALREANQQGLASPDVINQSLQAELDAVRAARDADFAEMNAILAAIGPLLDAQKEQEVTSDA
jgi:chromosome segregation ATPase